MIQPSELRIGNLVSISDTPCAVRAIYEDGQVQLEYKYNSSGEVKTSLVIARTLEGIPLTSQWLEKMGYKEDHHNYYIGSIMALSVHARYYSGILYLQVPNGMYLGDRIKFVHEYQNLYHALTGNELEVKP